VLLLEEFVVMLSHLAVLLALKDMGIVVAQLW
jgi:hypothetical protein